jgi:hypothetical protein
MLHVQRLIVEYDLPVTSATRRRLPSAYRENLDWAGISLRDPFGHNWGYYVMVTNEFKVKADWAYQKAATLGFLATAASVGAIQLLNPKRLGTVLALSLIPPILYTELISFIARMSMRKTVTLSKEEFRAWVIAQGLYGLVLNSFAGDYDAYQLHLREALKETSPIQGISIVGSSTAAYVLFELLWKQKYKTKSWLWLGTFGLLGSLAVFDNIYSIITVGNEPVAGGMKIAHGLHIAGWWIGIATSYYC